jgi:hypothetical protein
MAITDLSPESAKAVRDAVRFRESRGNYQAVNSQGFFGGYQFGCAAAQDVGLVKQGTFDRNLSIVENNRKCDVESNWTIPGGKQAFLNNPQLQDQAFDRYASQNVKTLKRLGVVDSSTPESDIGGYVAASHISGAGGARDLSKGTIRTDANGTTNRDYFSLGKTAVSNAQSSPQSAQVTDRDREEATRIQQESGNPDAITAEEVARRRVLDSGRPTAAGNEVRRLPNQNVYRGATEDGDLGDAEAAEYRKFQETTADRYGTSIDTEQTRILAEQDSWFTASGNQGVAGRTSGILPNSLSEFSVFNYKLTLGAYSAASLSSIIEPMQMIKIVESGNGPKSRVTIDGGDWDFYFGDVEIESLIGYSRMSKGTNVTNITFDVIEPYSIGLFLQALQVATLKADPTAGNYANGAFVLMVEFVGHDDDGYSITIDNTTRYIALRLTNVEIDVDTKGSRYKISAIPWTEQALSDNYSKIKSDISFSFKKAGPYTLGELLKNSDEGLEKVVNIRNKELLKDSKITPDEIEIVFPEGSTDLADTKFKFTANTGGATAGSKEQDVIENNNVNRKNIKYDPNNRQFQFKQGTSMISIINEVMMHTEYCKKSLESKVQQPIGMIDWFKIETGFVPISPVQGTGRPAYKIQYRIVKYRAHSSRLTHPNTKPDYASLLSNVSKEYNYIYTGKNTEVLNFNINLKLAFFTTTFADRNKIDPSTVYRSQLSSAGQDQSDTNPYTKKDPSEFVDGQDPGNPRPITGSSIDRRSGIGGGPTDDDLSLLARSFQENLLNSSEEMLQADIDIMGDPYYIVSSGTANYSMSNTGSFNVTSNGEVDYQNGEVHVIFNFRTPIDIDPDTGLADFGKTEIAKGFSGLYQLVSVTNSFKAGKFTQTLHAFRLPNQSKSAEGPAVDKPQSDYVAAETVYTYDISDGYA